MYNKAEYQKQWRKDNPELSAAINKKWRESHKEQQKAYKKKYNEENKDRIKIYYLNRNKERRKKILDIISGGNPVCVRCGCDDIRLLEINHKNGGGTKETNKGRNASQFWNDIRSGKRKTNDLELLCKICNAEHALELKFGKLPFTITYQK